LRAAGITGGDASSQGGSGVFGSPDDLHDPFWGNGSLSLRYAGTSGATGMQVVASAGRYTARLPLGDSIPLFAQGTSNRFRLTADFSRTWGDGAIRFGGTVDRLTARYDARDYASAGAPLVETRGQGTLAGAYLEAQRPLSPQVSLRGGLRLDHFSDGHGIRLAPRVSLAWSVTDQALLTLAAGQYHQYARAPSEEMEVVLGNPLATVPDADLLPVARATHLLVSLEQGLTPGVGLGVDGFVKSFSGVSGVQGGALRASGMDLRVNRVGESFTGWIGYSLQWFWTPDESGQVTGSSFAGRHLLSAGLLGTVAERFAVDVRVSYGNGLPYTTIPLADGESAAQDLRYAGSEMLDQGPGLSGGPDRDFLRVDTEVSATFEPRWRGRAFHITPYLRVLNALNRRDALFYYFEPWRDASVRPLAEMSFLPVLGVKWRF
ncbi:MAG: TonB-dependent receptor, partial [Gemmatimonadetes bacterium]|nr:TonB-dependent receptor [Gemmatimonadota bacterium]